MIGVLTEGLRDGSHLELFLSWWCNVCVLLDLWMSLRRRTLSLALTGLPPTFLCLNETAVRQPSSLALCELKERLPPWLNLIFGSLFHHFSTRPLPPTRSIFWHLHSSPPFHYLTSCHYDLPDKGLSLFTLSKVHKRSPSFRCQLDWLIVLVLYLLSNAVGFLKVEATDLNKCLSIMYAMLKLWKLAEVVIYCITELAVERQSRDLDVAHALLTGSPSLGLSLST